MLKKITVQRLGGDLIVTVDNGSSNRTHTLPGNDWDVVSVTLFGEGCAERYITDALEVLKTENSTIIMAAAER